MELKYATVLVVDDEPTLSTRSAWLRSGLMPWTMGHRIRRRCDGRRRIMALSCAAL